MLESGGRLQHDVWAPHLAICKSLARDVAVSCNDKAHCMVLGSKHMLDIPLGDLVAKVERVDLVDLGHPCPAVKRAGDFLNVYLITTCISGEARALFDLSHLPDPPNTAFPRPPGFSKVCREGIYRGERHQSFAAAETRSGNVGRHQGGDLSQWCQSVTPITT